MTVVDNLRGSHSDSHPPRGTRPRPVRRQLAVASHFNTRSVWVTLAGEIPWTCLQQNFNRCILRKLILQKVSKSDILSAILARRSRPPGRQVHRPSGSPWRPPTHRSHFPRPPVHPPNTNTALRPPPTHPTIAITLHFHYPTPDERTSSFAEQELNQSPILPTAVPNPLSKTTQSSRNRHV